MKPTTAKHTLESCKDCSATWSEARNYVILCPLHRAAPELLDAAKSALDFINSFKSCVPDWKKLMKVSGEGYTEKLKKVIAQAEGGK